MQLELDPLRLKDMPALGSYFASQYQLESIVGIGAAGVVYKSQQLMLERDVALKILPRNAVADSQVRKRFLTESQVISTLNHPNIVQGFTSGISDDGYPFLATEFIKGENLAEFLAKTPLDAERLKTIFAQIFSALKYAHEQGIVHRDLKPENIMLADSGELKILDFGIAKILNIDTAGISMVAAQTASLPGAFLGSANYMSPEQAQGGMIDQRSDIYALGVLLYQCFTGRLPFDSSSPMHVLYQHANEPVPVLLATDSAIDSGALDVVVRKCMEKDPQNRFQSVAQLNEQFLYAMSIQTATAKASSKNTRKRLGLIIVASLILAICLFDSMKQLFHVQIAKPKPLQGVNEDHKEAYYRRPMALRVGKSVVTPYSLIVQARHFRKSADDANSFPEKMKYLNQAIQFYDEALLLLQKKPDRYLTYLSLLSKARCQSHLMVQYYDQKRKLSSEGIDLGKKTLPILEEAEQYIHKDTFEESLIKMKEAQIYLELGEFQKSEQLFQQTLKLKQGVAEMCPESAPYSLDTHFIEEDECDAKSAIYMGLCQIAFRQGNLPLYEHYLKQLYEHGFERLEWYRYDNFVSLFIYPEGLIDLKKTKEAEAVIAELDRKIHQIDPDQATADPDHFDKAMAQDLYLLADSYLRLGKQEKYAKLMQESGNFFEKCGCPRDSKPSPLHPMKISQLRSQLM